jgi:hypothetical protein
MAKKKGGGFMDRFMKKGGKGKGDDKDDMMDKKMPRGMFGKGRKSMRGGRR